jgi:hypothetical protein
MSEADTVNIAATVNKRMRPDRVAHAGLAIVPIPLPPPNETWQRASDQGNKHARSFSSASHGDVWRFSALASTAQSNVRFSAQVRRKRPARRTLDRRSEAAFSLPLASA